tara:strand:- start:358 stop:2634 length:2277 start_codon:yes stop_codon:yes gene_type:complete
MHNIKLSQSLSHESLCKINAVSQKDIPVENWRVSSVSKFSDDFWILDGSATESDRKARFASPLPLGQPPLTDPGYEGLLLDCKLIIWSVGITNFHASHGTKANSTMRYLRAIFAWMVRENLPDFSYVTRDRVWADGGIDNPSTFASFLLEHLGGEPDEIVHTTPINYLNMFSMLFREFAILEVFGRRRLPEHPFGTNESSNLANLIGKKEMEQWRPVPDEVLVPLLNASEDWLGQRAEDVLHILEVYQNERSYHVNRGVGPGYATALSRSKLAEFKFSMDGESPWHESLDGYSSDESLNAQDGSVFELGRLVRCVQSAALIAIQQTSGMRSAELLSITSKLHSDGTPVCIEERNVANGTKTLVILHAFTSKINGGIPEAHEWIVGVKPNLPFGSAPDVRAQRAVNILIRLGSILKTKMNSKNALDLLFFAWGSGGPPTDGSNLRPFNNYSHNEAIRSFLAHTCQKQLELLPDDSLKLVQDGWLGQWRDANGAILHSHQLRKSFANFAYSMQPGLKEEIRIQYGHMSVVMTGRYTHNDHQIKQMNEMEAQLAAEHIVAALSESALAGQGAHETYQRSDWKDLRSQFDDADPQDRHRVVTEWLLHTRRLVDEEYRVVVGAKRELRKISRSAISNASHGLCAAISIRGSDMECRKDGKSTDSLLDGLGADKRYRTPSRCLGCINYLVLPHHRPYWEDRFRRAQQAVLFFKSQGCPVSSYETQLHTAKQSKTWLRAIGVSDIDLNRIEEDCAIEVRMDVANG